MDLVMVEAKTAAQAAGGFFNNPSTFALAAIGIGLFLFRDKISDFFQKGFDSLSEGLVNIELPDLNLGDVNIANPFEGFDLNKFFGLDSSSSIAGETVPTGTDGSTITIPADTIVNPDGTVSSSTSPILNLDDESRQAAIDALNANKILNETFQDPFFGDSELVSAFNQTEFEKRRDAVLDSNLVNEITAPIRTMLDSSDTIIVPAADELNIGGGLSFIGGTTTFGDNIIDTFSEVLNIFPNLRANEIDDLLLQNVGLSGSEFALINPNPIPSLSSEGFDADQIINNAGQFSGLTSEQIANLITGGNLSNF